MSYNDPWSWISFDLFDVLKLIEHCHVGFLDSFDLLFLFQVDVEVIDTEEPILKPSLPASSLSFSISNLLGNSIKSSSSKSCGSPSGTSSSSDSESVLRQSHPVTPFHHFAQHFAQGQHSLPHSALPFRPFKTEVSLYFGPYQTMR